MNFAGRNDSTSVERLVTQKRKSLQYVRPLYLELLSYLYYHSHLAVILGIV
jgi:hypothetical protein